MAGCSFLPVNLGDLLLTWSTLLVNAQLPGNSLYVSSPADNEQLSSLSS